MRGMCLLRVTVTGAIPGTIMPVSPLITRDRWGWPELLLCCNIWGKDSRRHPATVNPEWCCRKRSWSRHLRGINIIFASCIFILTSAGCLNERLLFIELCIILVAPLLGISRQGLYLCTQKLFFIAHTTELCRGGDGCSCFIALEPVDFRPQCSFTGLLSLRLQRYFMLLSGSPTSHACSEGHHQAVILNLGCT